MDLIKFVETYSKRGSCMCGRCIDAPEKSVQPSGHTVNLTLFTVGLKGDPDKNKFIELIKQHAGEFNDVDVFDGKEHGYIELGGWIGDQGMALMFIGLGGLLGTWDVLSPDTIPAFADLPADLKMNMATSGLVSLQVEKYAENQ